MERISIRPEREYLREIVSKISSNTYAIPAFQRDFVWKKNQILDLFDSISKGYPIGSIILWKPKGSDLPPVKDVTTEEISEVSPSDYYILDGRQRCTAFYGCVMEWDDKPFHFQLYYDVESDIFLYPSKRKRKDNLYPVSSIYDTFKMLGLMQEIMQGNMPADKKNLHIAKLKEINTILQTYEIGEIIIENCTLEESSVVFSRINSKGTDISKVAMLQALTYKSRNSLLLANEIDDILSSLSTYGFQQLKSDDILSCCYKYVNKNHYDNNVLEALSKADISEIVPKLRTDILASVKFLNETCGVISNRLLPYNRQLFAIASFFKEIETPSEAQLAELKKWFFYTTYQQVFLNGSLGNVRAIFNRFEDFVKGRKDTAIDYEPIEIDYSLDFKFAPASALSDFIVLCQVLKRREMYPDEHLEYTGEYRFGGNKPAHSFALLTSNDRDTISKLLYEGLNADDVDKYCLNQEMLECLGHNKRREFFNKRKQNICNSAKLLLESLGLQIKPLQEPIEAEVNIEAFISEFEDLYNVEKRELCEILSSNEDVPHSVIYEVKKVGENMFSVNYSSFEHPYLFTKEIAKKCLHIVEDRFCNGEDAESYFNWLIALEDEDL